MKRKILIIAGEVSGDQHAADLVGELKKFDGEIEFAGIGGDRLAAEGVHLHYHLSQLAVLGFSEIVKHLPFIRKVLKHMKQELKGGVQAVILVDYPGFNLRVARLAREAGVPVIYYISPQLWAWGEKRVEKMRRYVDLLLVLFRFEVEFYRRHGITAHFVGHPLIDQIPAEADSAEFRRAHDLPLLRLTPYPARGIMRGSQDPWGGSSAGRASRSQCEGREFDPPPVHQEHFHSSPNCGPASAHIGPCQCLRDI